MNDEKQRIDGHCRNARTYIRLRIYIMYLEANPLVAAIEPFLYCLLTIETYVVMIAWWWWIHNNIILLLLWDRANNIYYLLILFYYLNDCTLLYTVQFDINIFFDFINFFNKKIIINNIYIITQSNINNKNIIINTI